MTLIRVAMSAALIVTPYFALAEHDQLSLKHGTYVIESSSCKDPAFAVTKFWDGVGFSGPHAHKCVSHVTSHYANQFDVRTTCSAVGDGTPNPSGQAYVEVISLTRLSNTRIVISTQATAKANYRWCSVK